MTAANDWLIAGGETGELIRSMDWSATPLGPRDLWPYPLRTIVNIALSSTFAMAILWGNELILIYNDAYRVIAADKHPRAMGRSTREIWPEVWQFNKPIFEKVMREGHAVHLEHQLFRIRRRAETEDAYFTLSYSPIRSDHDRVGGTLVTLIETTWRKHTEEALQTSQDELAEAQRTAELHVSKERYRAVLEDQTELISRFKADGTLTFANERWGLFFGKNIKDLIGNKCQPQEYKDVLQKISQQLKKISVENPVVVIENHVQDVQGRKCWIQFVNRGLFDEKGQLVEIQTVGRDISILKENEQVLRKREMKMGEHLQISPDTVGFHRKNLRKKLEIQYSNTELSEYLKKL